MNKSLFFKFFAIGFLMLLLLIPIFMIRDVILERKDRQQDVLQEIAKGSSYSQRLVGPVLVVPYLERQIFVREDASNKQTYREVSWVQRYQYFLPEMFALDGKMKTEIRSRGIFQARLFHAENQISGHFDVPEKFGLEENNDDLQIQTPYISFGIKDTRGIENALKIKINDELLDMQPGTQLKLLGDGVHANLEHLKAGTQAKVYFSFELALQGTESFSVIPLGRESATHLTSDWPHPSLIGNYSAIDRNVTAQGFTANWRTSYFSTGLKEVFDDCKKNAVCEALEERSYGVSFINPIDHYAQSDRATKYAILFIALTFAGFFLFEILKKLAIHPIQYGLVGLALALFFLLLISLSEHIAFAVAYAISSSACILLIGVYMSSVLRSRLGGFIFSGLLVSLYSVLYALLCAEDYALLMGSLFVFALLTLFMLLTRHLDWYSIGKTAEVEQQL